MDTSYNSKEIVWHTDALPSATKKALDFLSTRLWLKKGGWYLAGGTALALQAGHRTSQDLDFFNAENFSSQGLVKKFPAGAFKTTILREGTVYGNLLEAKISFIFYPSFIPKEPLLFYKSVGVLHEKDIAVMKIVAISQRGTKRDFIDLYWYCQNREPLIDVVQKLKEQYPSIRHNYHHVIKSLTFFDDADDDPLPKIFFQANWVNIKKFFQKEVPIITRKFLVLD